MTVPLSANAVAPSAVARHARDRTTIRVTDYGADPAGVQDSASALAAAFTAARRVGGPVTVEFPRGIYQLYPENAEHRELYVSNTIGTDPEGRIKAIALLIEDMADVIIDGHGSLLLFHGRQTQVAVLRSSDVTIRDMRTDWVSAGTLDLTVIASGTEDGRGFRDVRLPLGVDVDLTGGMPVFTGERSPEDGEPYWRIDPAMFTQWQQQVRDLPTGTTRRGPWLWDGVMDVDQRGQRTLRLWYRSPRDPGGVGTVHEFRRTYRDTPAALIFESARVQFTQLAMHYLHGFGFVGQISEDIALRDLRMIAAPGTWRQTAGFADFVHMSGVGGRVEITGCLFDNPHDDPINIHGTYLQITGIDRTERILDVRYMQKDAAGFPAFRNGDELRFISRRTMLVHAGASARVAEILRSPSGYDRAQDLRTLRIRLDREIPAVLEVERDVVENVTLTPQVLISGCEFTSVPTRGILLTTLRPSVIEHNRFDRMGMSSIYISDDANGWYESGHVENLTIRRNIIDRPTANQPVLWCEPMMEEYEPGRFVHSGIHLEENEIQVPRGTSALTALAVKDLTLIANTLQVIDPIQEERAQQESALVLEHVGEARLTRTRVRGELDLTPRREDTHAGAVTLEGTVVLPAAADDATLPTLTWPGMSLTQAAPRCWLAFTGPEVPAVRAMLKTGEHTEVVLRLRMEQVSPAADGSLVLPLESGPNLLDMVSRDPTGARWIQRWVIIADLPPRPHAAPCIPTTPPSVSRSDTHAPRTPGKI